MLFSSILFLFLFLPLTLFGYFIVFRKKRKAQNIFLFLVSLFFYAWGEPWFVLVMISSIIANWFFGLLIDKYRNNPSKSKWIISLMLLFNLSIIFVFKYLMFTIENLNALINTQYKITQILLPIGISFFTFQAISYVIDIYRKDGQVQKNPLNVGLYIAFFPQLIAGPIVRYQTIAKELISRKETLNDFYSGVERFILGLGKKILIANNMAIIADKAFSYPIDDLSFSWAWLGALAYTLQIFFDFSGYSDMAIGLGRMFGFHFLENFNYPYVSKSITEFWRRWHISLGTWFRDYVYIPLGGNRVKTRYRLIFNLFIVWLLTGIWHGANWTFICWGLMYFLLLTFEKLTGFEKRPGTIFKYLYTMFFVIIGWVIFRSENITDAFHYIHIMMTGNNNLPLISPDLLRYTLDYKYLILSGILFSMPLSRFYSYFPQNLRNNIKPIILLALLLFSSAYIIKGTYNPFIYFNF